MKKSKKFAEASSRYRARQRGENIPLRKRGTVLGSRFCKVRHGTATEYGRYGCRCELCTKASTEHAKKYRNPIKNREAVKRNQKVNLLMVREAKNKPCTDCKISYPYYVMQFDHLRDKKYALQSGRARSLGKQNLLDEIAKCEVVCANCHMERSHKRRTA